MKFVFLTSMIIVSAFFQSVALADQSTVRDIVNLSRSIENAAGVSGISDANLSQAKKKLQDVLQLLTTGHEPTEPGLPMPDGCFDFAYAKYFETFSSEGATDKAIAACKIITDMNVLRFAFQKNYETLSAAGAMDKSARQAGPNMQNKIELVTFAFNIYYQMLSSAAAIELAATNSAKVSTQSLTCVQSLYDKYQQTLSPKGALDKAFAGCSNQ